MSKHVGNSVFRFTLALSLGIASVPAPELSAQATFHVDKGLYSETAHPTSDIAAAVAASRRDGKRILLDFGGNWCSDCQVLDFYYHQAPNVDLLNRYYRVIHIDIGHMDHNVDVAQKYHVPIARGVPALAVLDSNGKLLYNEKEKEFEHTSPEAITVFLNRWKR